MTEPHLIRELKLIVAAHWHALVLGALVGLAAGQYVGTHCKFMRWQASAPLQLNKAYMPQAGDIITAAEARIEQYSFCREVMERLKESEKVCHHRINSSRFTNDWVFQVYVRGTSAQEATKRFQALVAQLHKENFHLTAKKGRITISEVVLPVMTTSLLTGAFAGMVGFLTLSLVMRRLRNK